MFSNFAMAVYVITLSISVQFNLDQDHKTSKTMFHVLATIIIAWKTQNTLFCVI